MSDFSAKTLRLLARKGITIMSLVIIPDMKSPMPWANGERGYSVNDNGCNRVWTFAQVLNATEG